MQKPSQFPVDSEDDDDDVEHLMLESETSITKSIIENSYDSINKNTNTSNDIFSNLKGLSSLVNSREFVPKSQFLSRDQSLTHNSNLNDNNNKFTNGDQKDNPIYSSESPYYNPYAFAGVECRQSEVSTPLASSRQNQVDVSLPWLVCQSCGQEFVSEQVFRNHTSMCSFEHSNSLPDVTSSQYSTSNDGNSRRLNDDRPLYTCLECRSTFLSPQEYQHHIEYSGHRSNAGVSSSYTQDYSRESDDYSEDKYTRSLSSHGREPTAGPSRNISGPTYYSEMDSNRPTQRDIPRPMQSFSSSSPYDYPPPQHYPPSRSRVMGGPEMERPHPSVSGNISNPNQRYPAIHPDRSGYPHAQPKMSFSFGNQAAHNGPMINPNLVNNPNHWYGFDPNRGSLLDRFITVYFAGISKKDSLTGGCGWSLMDEHYRVVTQGSCYVVQNFPSQLRLEFEALLNGLKAAITNGFTHVLVAGTSAIVLSYIRGGVGISNFLQTFKSVQTEIIDLTGSIRVALRVFREVRVESISESENIHCIKQAEKALHAFQKKKKKEINRLVFTDYGTKKVGGKGEDDDVKPQSKIYDDDI